MIQQTLFSGGKRIRPAIVLLVGNTLGGPKDELIRLAAAIELLHNATLIHDDLIDQAALRHHQPTIHTLCSPQLTVLIGDYLFAYAAKIAAEIDNPGTAKIFAETLITIVDGEITQYSDSRLKPDLSLYEKRIYQKTASLFEASASIAAGLCTTDPTIREAMRSFGNHVGMAFQMMDDVLDIIGTESILGKPVGSDLKQGLLNLPTILYLKDYPDSPYTNRILEGSCLKRDNSDVLQAIRESSAIAKSFEKIDQHLIASQKQLAVLPESSGRHYLLEMVNYLSRRIH